MGSISLACFEGDTLDTSATVTKRSNREEIFYYSKGVRINDISYFYFGLRSMQNTLRHYLSSG